MEDPHVDIGSKATTTAAGAAGSEVIQEIIETG